MAKTKNQNTCGRKTPQVALRSVMANDISKTAIINLALANLGQKLISSENEETQTARTAKLIYDVVRRNLLRAHDWVFALRFAYLPAVETKSPFIRLPHVFALPADYLFLKTISYDGLPDRHHFPFKLFNDEKGNKLVACTDTKPQAQYVADVADTTLFDPAFVACFVLLLAAELAIPITGDSNLARLMLSKYQSKLDEARLANKVEQFEVPEKTSCFLEAR